MRDTLDRLASWGRRLLADDLVMFLVLFVGAVLIAGTLMVLLYELWTFVTTAQPIGGAMPRALALDSEGIPDMRPLIGDRASPLRPGR